MMKPLGVILIVIALIWAFIILIVYSDNMMSSSQTMLYSLICLLMIGSGIFLMIKPQK